MLIPWDRQLGGHDVIGMADMLKDRAQSDPIALASEIVIKEHKTGFIVRLDGKILDMYAIQVLFEKIILGFRYSN